MGDSSNNCLDSYRRQLRKFINAQIRPADFESAFLALYTRDDIVRDPAIEKSLERFFFVVEDFSAEPALRMDGDPDEVRLRDSAVELLKFLERYE